MANLEANNSTGGISALLVHWLRHQCIFRNEILFKITSWQPMNNFWGPACGGWLSRAGTSDWFLINFLLADRGLHCGWSPPAISAEVLFWWESIGQWARGSENSRSDVGVHGGKDERWCDLGPIQVSEDAPPFPWVRLRFWAGLGEWWVNMSPETWIELCFGGGGGKGWMGECWSWCW